MMGLAERTEIKRPVLDSRPSKKEMARFLLNTHYTSLYGIAIRHESVRSMRSKINELKVHLMTETQLHIRRAMTQQCHDFERVCMLLEVLM